MERIYPAYAGKIQRNTTWAKKNARDFANQLNVEYKKVRKSKAKAYEKIEKLPVRIYGSGDFVPEHLSFMKLLDFKFYIISKSLTDPKFTKYIPKLLELPNLTKIVLSIDDQNLANYAAIKKYYKQDKFGISYTGTADDFKNLKACGLETTIFFNTGRKKEDLLKSRKLREQCPCDSGILANAKACAVCNKCWRSSVTQPKDWNIN